MSKVKTMPKKPQEARDSVPASLSGVEADYYAVIVSHLQEANNWQEVDMQMVEMLAQTYGDIQRERALLVGEGSIVDSDQGPKKNPRCTVINELQGQYRGLASALGLGAAARRRLQIEISEEVENPWARKGA